MVPNTRLFFFFTVNEMACVSEDYMIIGLEDEEKVRFKFKEDDELETQFLLSSMNIFETNLTTEDIIDPDTYEPRIQCVPREPRPQYKMNKVKTRITRKEKWNVNMSLFKDWRIENEELLKKCFETDWAGGKYSGYIKDEEDRLKVKEFLREHYKITKDCYKYWSSHTPLEQLNGIGSNDMGAIVNAMELISKNL